MAQFLISKHDPASPTDWAPIQVIYADPTDDLEELVKQGFAGDGNYAISRWDNRREFTMRTGQPIVTDIAPGGTAQP